MRLFLSIAVLAMASAGSPAMAAPTPFGVSFQRVGAMALASGSAPGIALAVVHGGEVVYEGGFGFADVASHRPVNAHTPFAIGSLTKQFTAAAILMLERDRKLALDDQVSRFMPSLPNAKRTTLAMLLEQTSGLHNYPNLAEHAWPTRGPIALSRILAVLSTDRSDFVPGTKWAYSNANYATLAAVAEKASGMSLADVLQARLFTPLAMHDSGLGYVAQNRAGLAIGYVNGKPEIPALSLDLYSGAGAAIASAHDMALWDRALMRGSLLPHSVVARMWSPGRLHDGAPVPYAMGWVPTSVAGHREVWHNGVAPGVGGYCYNAIFPDDGLAVAVLTNGFGAQGLPERMVGHIAAAYGIGPLKAEVSAGHAPVPGNAAIDALARSFWNQLATGEIQRDALTPQFSAALAPESIAQTKRGIVALGKPNAMTLEETNEQNGVTVYRYALTYASGAQSHWTIAITTDRKIAGSRLEP